jgi:hypothetical protein
MKGYLPVEISASLNDESMSKFTRAAELLRLLLNFAKCHTQPDEEGL